MSEKAGDVHSILFCRVCGKVIQKKDYWSESWTFHDIWFVNHSVCVACLEKIEKEVKDAKGSC